MGTSSGSVGSNSFTRVMKLLTKEGDTNSQISALTSLRRSHIEDKSMMKELKEDEFCQLCNSVINATATDNDKLHIEACRTLDIVLPESRDRKFDFFKSILQTNRKKRHKILVSLRILKDETVAAIANKHLSIINFLSDCLQSIQPSSMIWLLKENTDNAELLKNVESKTLNETEMYEEKLVEETLRLLAKLCSLSSLGLNVRQFDKFIMDKILPLVYMGHKKQRSCAMMVFQEAVHNDLGTRVRSFNADIWAEYKVTLQAVYCKRMTMLVNSLEQDWSAQWETTITFIGTDLHKGSQVVNSLLKVEEIAFKSVDFNRRQAFLSWKVLIDNFALDQRELATPRRIRLLCTPLTAKNTKTEQMILTKLQVWWHLIYKVYPSIFECIETVLFPFLNICFGPFGDKPLFVQSTESTVSLGKKFKQTLIFGVDAFIQLIVNKNEEQNISLAAVQEKLPNPVSNAVFEQLHKTFIYSFGEIVFALSLSAEDEIPNKLEVSQVLWKNLIQRIEGYDKMKVSMYKEVTTVIVEIINSKFHKIQLVKDFLLSVMLKNHDNIVCHMQIPETVLLELIEMFLHVDNFSSFTNNHYESIEALLWHLIKPKNADVFYPRTMELMQAVISTLNESIKCHKYQTCEMWCVLAKIANKYAEDSRNINEGNRLKHNFKTIESILALPFNSLYTDDQQQLINMVKTWVDLYKQLDFQAGLIVTVQPHEIVEKIAETILKALQKDRKCCVFAILCADGLFETVNYEKILSDDKVPSFVILLKELTLQSLKSTNIVSEKILKTMSTFLLMVFNLNDKKTALQRIASYLNILKPAIQYMIQDVDDNSLEKPIVDTWSTIVGLLKKLHKFLNCELLNAYRQTIISAMLHLNSDISRSAFSILDIMDSLDQDSQKVLKEIMDGLNQTSAKNKTNNTSSAKEKSNKKMKSPHVKPIGSFLDRKTNSPSSKKVQNGKENVEKPAFIDIEPDSQDYVTISNDLNIDVNRLTDHQKEMLKKRRDDIPAMYNDLSVSNTQDSQQLQYWFDAKTGKSPASSKKETSMPTNNNQESPTSLHFKNITKVFASKKEEEKTDKTTRSLTVTSPKAAAKKLQVEAPLVTTTKAAATAAATSVTITIEDEFASVVEDSQRKGSDDDTTPVAILPKKLDFESHDEFPAAVATAAAAAAADTEQQVSPSIIDNKMRRSINRNDDANAKAQDKILRTRRSLQRSSSSEQLNKRGRKRRNSETNSEGPLDIEREKRPRRENESAAVSADTPEYTSSEEKNSITQEIDGKKMPKRTMCEMSRLKIDMKFEQLPNRRSFSKLSDVVSNDRKFMSKEEKSINNTKLDTNQQQATSVNTTVSIRRRSGLVGGPKVDVHEKDATVGSRTSARKSLPGKIIPPSIFAHKKSDIVQETQESMIIEGVMTQNDKITEKVNDTPDSETQKTNDSESMLSQDPDIVESSQEPSGVGSKLDKNSCFVKISKVEVQQIAKGPEESSEREEKIREPSQSDLDETSFVPGTIPPEKATIVQEVKKTEIISANKPSAIPSSNTASPKSSKPRILKTSKFIPPQGRAAQMLAFVTKQSLAEKLETNLSEEVTIVPIPKKDRTPNRNESQVVSSPGGSRQEKMFNNMNNNKKQELCTSPSIEKFLHLKNDGERISPKLDKSQRESEIDSCENNVSLSAGDASPINKHGKELPMFEWNAHPPSLTASPSASILKRLDEGDLETPSRKKRVSFADPPVSREMGYQIEGSASSSPPKLEKLPSIRSPIPRREPRKHVKQRLIQIEQEEMLEKENDVMLLSNTEKSTESATTDELNNIVTVPKVKLASVLTEISVEESKVVEIEEYVETNTNTQDVDMFMDNNGSAENESVDVVKTSTQTDQNNSLIKLDSINLSNIMNKSNTHQVSLEDTVDVDNMSSSIESMNSERPVRSGSSHSSEQADTLPATDSVFSNPTLSQETQSTVAHLNEPENLDSTLPVYPSLISCIDAVESVSVDLVEPLFKNNLAQHLSMKSINSIGDLAQLSERDINRLPIKGPKIECVKKALAKYEEKVASLNKTPEKRIASIVPSSTPLGNNKRFPRNKSENDSFEDLVSNNVSVLTSSQSRRSKRLSMDNSMQTSPVKRQKKNFEESFTELMEQYDEDALLNALVDKVSYEKVLKVCKNKMNGKSEKEVKKETLNILGLSLEDDSEASFRASTKSAGLQKVLQQLPKIFDDDEAFIDNVVKAYKKRLHSKKLLNILAVKLEQDKGDKSVLDTNDLKIVLNKSPLDLIIDQVEMRNEMKAVLDKASIDLIIDQVQSRNELEQVLEKAPTDLIIDSIKSRNIFEHVAKEIPTDVLIKQVGFRNEFKQVLNKVSSDLVVDHIQNKDDLKSSEKLLNILLENASEELTKNTIRTLFEAVQERIEITDLGDLYNEAVKAEVDKYKRLLGGQNNF